MSCSSGCARRLRFRRVSKVQEDVGCLELFHGPTLAFKDFGGRFMAQMLTHIAGDKPVTILTATSGDTGAAVAHAFYGLPNVKVVILYPRGKISPLQEKLFCTLGGNIETVAIDGDFDACQALVKQAFDDEELKATLGLNSANSINISRLLAQICYYFEAAAQLPQEARNQLVISVPSGNFGDLTAGLLAKSLGLPIKRFIAATNANDTVPRYLQGGEWAPKATQATLSNAMDVSQPNNWPRVEELFRRKIWRLSELGYAAVDDETTKAAMRELKAIGYISLGALNDTVKAVKVDGAEATVDNVKAGAYKLSRPFNIATKGEPTGVAKDFINFILSKEGQAVVTDNKYIAVDDNAAAFTSDGSSGQIAVGGSSSVSPVMEKLIEAYKAVNPNASIDLQTSDSTSGMTGTMDGTFAIGMASRELKDDEAAQLTGTAIALDGIAVVVNPANTIDDLSMDQIKGIYVGDITDWGDLA